MEVSYEIKIIKILVEIHWCKRIQICPLTNQGGLRLDDGEWTSTL